MDQIQQLQDRLERLEQNCDTWRQTARRYRGAAVVLAVAGSAALLAAQNDAPDVTDVIQAKRIEVVDDNGRLVFAAAADALGGRVDIWTNDGQNVFRASSNDKGGDMNVWNRDGTTVFAAFSGDEGGEFGMWSENGIRTFRLASTETGGLMTIADVTGETVVAASAKPEGGAVEITGITGGPAVSITADSGGSGQIVAFGTAGKPYFGVTTSDLGSALTLSDPGGDRRSLMTADAKGGGFTVVNPRGVPVVSVGVADPSGGGFVDVANGEGTLVGSIAAEDDGCGRIDLGNADGQRVFSVDGIADVGAAMALLSAKGRKAFVVGTRPEGGIMNIYNKHEVPVYVAGYARSGLGGAMSIKNGRGLPVVHAVSGEDDTGRISVYDAEGQSSRTLDPTSKK